MKILNVSYSDLFGGAAKSAYRIHNLLNTLKNIKSEMLVVKKLSQDKNIITLNKKNSIFFFKLKNYFGMVISKFDTNNNPKSYNFFNSPLLKLINQSDCDLINLHWINAETVSLEDIKKINKPLIITMHDMWWLCGTENYLSYGDNKWKSGNFNNVLSNYNFKKKLGISPIAVVCPSKWLFKISKKSLLYKNSIIKNIPYPINQKIFFPKRINKIKRLNLIKNNKVKIFFGVFGNSTDYRKGIDLLIKSLNKIDQNLFELIIASKNEFKNDIKFSIKNLNFIEDEKELSKIYNICDIVAITSRLDNLPNIALEAQSCGKPIIGYNVGGISDIINNNINGYLIEPFNTRKFSRKLEFLIKNKSERNKFSKNAFKYAKKKWSERIIGNGYKNFLSNLT